MLGIVLAVLGLMAIFSWVVALASAIRIVSFAPKGQRMRTYGRIGWWKFADIRTALGPAVDPNIQAYQRSFVAFFVCLIASIAIGSMMGMTVH